MTAALLALGSALLGAAAATLPGDGVEFVEHRVRVDGQVLDRAFVDFGGDGRLDLVVAVRAQAAGAAEGRRALHVYALGADGSMSARAEQVIPVMDDVVAWACADVRPDPGRELLFLTPGGAWSYTPTRRGYRDNIARLVDTALLYDMPDPEELPLWRYVLPARPAGGGAGDALLLPGSGGYALWRGASGEAYVDATHFGGGDDGVTYHSDAPGRIEAGQGRIRFDIGARDQLFLDDSVLTLGALLRGEGSFRSPALVDVDGDGRTDLLVRDGDELAVFLDTGAGIPARPQRTETRPEWLDPLDTSLSQTLHDVDRDGDLDIVARVSEDRDGLDARVIKILVLINDGQRLYPESPAQVLRFEGNEVRYLLSDVDRDGRTDLVITKYDMPSLVDLATGFELRRSTFLFLGRGQEPFERQPVLRDEQIYGLESVDTAIVGRYLDLDLSGDGVADLVEVDLTGRIAVRRLTRDKGWFGGETWTLEREPWRRFDVRGSITNMEVRDVNGDGLGDVVSHRADTLLLLLSRRGGAR